VPTGSRIARHRGLHLVPVVVALVVVVPSSVGATGPGAGRTASGPATPRTLPGRTVELRRAHVARPGPGVATGRGVRVAAHRPITLARTVLPVLDEIRGGDGRPWLRVLLPGRPNGAAGWIAGAGTVASTTAWALEVDLSRRHLLVRRAGRVVRRLPVIVGAPATPTPRGSFFVEESVRLPAGRPGGPYALALSARSEVLQEFDGGPGQIGLHGRNGLGGRLGSAVSHGCIRLDGRAVTWLARRVGPGVRVDVHG
jgi:lipoprotein-anchoring transpeptidase ErfK/SrfK